MDIYLATYNELPELIPEEQLLIEALKGRGVQAAPAVWDDPSVPWQQARMCVVRSAWDYHRRRADFLHWATSVSGLTALWNPVEALRWNTHKLYLSDLEERGVPIVPTLWLKAGRSADLAALMAGSGWQRAVLKPAVSASAQGTIIVEQDALDEAQGHCEALLRTGDAMLQPYLDSVETYGERSLLFFNGTYSHAVRRPPVLTQENVSFEDYIAAVPSPQEVHLAEQALRASGYETLYARADIAHYAGTPHLMELEMVEPSLFLLTSPGAVERFAEAIEERLGN